MILRITSRSIFKDLSIVSFLPKALQKFSKTKMGKLEKIEGIELIRY